LPNLEKGWYRPSLEGVLGWFSIQPGQSQPVAFISKSIENIKLKRL
jgi:hypothetical protein